MRSLPLPLASRGKDRLLKYIPSLRGRAVLIAVLVVANIPVYIFLGWLAFDNTEDAAETFFETITAVLKTVLVPGFVRVLMGMDTSGSWGLFPTVGFLLGCVAVVYGEYLLICKWFGMG